MAKMDGKLVLVTGATSGIGTEAAVELAKQGAKVVVHGRTQDKIDQVLARIKAEAGRDDAEGLLCDLADQADIKRACAEFLDRFDALDVLLNNAGAVHQERKLTKDGLEMTFGVNHISYYMVALLLLPALRRAKGARIVNVASDAHKGAKVNWDDLQGESSWSSMRSYCDSKLMNIWFTKALAKRVEAEGIVVNSLHPGVVATGFGRNDPGIFSRLVAVAAPFFRSPLSGARTSIWACSADEAGKMTGRYFVNCKDKRPAKLALDDASAQRLWTISEQLTGVHFPEKA